MSQRKNGVGRGHLAKRPRDISIWFANYLGLVLPYDFFANLVVKHSNGHAHLAKKPGAVMRPLDAFFGILFKPANTPNGITPFEVFTKLIGHAQIIIEPAKLNLELAVNPVRDSGSGYVSGCLKESGLDTGIRVDHGRNKSHMHDNLFCKPSGLTQKIYRWIREKLLFTALYLLERERPAAAVQHVKHFCSLHLEVVVSRGALDTVKTMRGQLLRSRSPNRFVKTGEFC